MSNGIFADGNVFYDDSQNYFAEYVLSDSVFQSHGKNEKKSDSIFKKVIKASALGLIVAASTFITNAQVDLSNSATATFFHDDPHVVSRYQQNHDLFEDLEALFSITNVLDDDFTIPNYESLAAVKLLINKLPFQLQSIACLQSDGEGDVYFSFIGKLRSAYLTIQEGKTMHFLSVVQGTVETRIDNVYFSRGEIPFKINKELRNLQVI